MALWKKDARTPLTKIEVALQISRTFFSTELPRAITAHEHHLSSFCTPLAPERSIEPGENGGDPSASLSSTNLDSTHGRSYPA
jgi:hypothetical protein